LWQGLEEKECAVVRKGARDSHRKGKGKKRHFAPGRGMTEGIKRGDHPKKKRRREFMGGGRKRKKTARGGVFKKKKWLSKKKKNTARGCPQTPTRKKGSQEGKIKTHTQTESAGKDPRKGDVLFSYQGNWCRGWKYGKRKKGNL